MTVIFSDVWGNCPAPWTFVKIIKTMSQQASSVKDQYSTYSAYSNCGQYIQLCRPCSLCHNYSALPLWYECSNQQYEWVWLCSSKTLWTLKFEFCVLLDCEILFLCCFFFFPTPFQNVKPFLACRLYRKRCWQIGLMDHALPIPDLGIFCKWEIHHLPENLINRLPK